MTDPKDLEQQLKELQEKVKILSLENERLAARVTAQEAQLRQSRQMESMSIFAGGVAHDFNNLLTSIIGFGQLAMRKMEKDDPNRLNIEEMLAASERAAHLTKKLLEFSRKKPADRKIADLDE